MLVQYVGLFMTGLHLGLLLGVGGLVISEQFHHAESKWLPIGVLFGAGVLFAVLSLYAQRGLTMLGTSMFGGFLFLTCMDYFGEQFLMLKYIWSVTRAEASIEVCWYSWIIVSIWPLGFLIGSIVQCTVTGKGFDHQQGKKTAISWLNQFIFFMFK